MVQLHNGLGDELGALRDDIKKIRSELRSLAEGVSNESRRQLRTAKKSLRKSASRRLDRLMDSVHHATETGYDAIHAAQKEFERRPFTMVATVLGLGFLLGRYLGREEM